MKRVHKLFAFVVPALALLITSGVSWYAFSAPPVENLPLANDLIAISSIEGRQLLMASSNKTDHGQLEPFLLPQSRRAFCGPAASAAVINAALQPPTKVTQASLFNPAASAIKSKLAVSFSGLTLEELAEFLRAHRLQVRTVHADQSDVAAFRTVAQSALSEPLTFVVVNYDRRALGQSGGGHISPIGAFSLATDRLLVLDVATYKYPYTWVPVTKLWSAMNTVDSDSGRTRGYLLVTAGSHREPPPLGEFSRWRAGVGPNPSFEATHRGSNVRLPACIRAAHPHHQGACNVRSPGHWRHRPG